MTCCLKTFFILNTLHVVAKGTNPPCFVNLAFPTVRLEHKMNKRKLRKRAIGQLAHSSWSVEFV